MTPLHVLLALEDSRAPPGAGPPAAFASPPPQAPDLFTSPTSTALPTPGSLSPEGPPGNFQKHPGPEFASQPDDGPDESPGVA